MTAQYIIEALNLYDSNIMFGGVGEPGYDSEPMYAFADWNSKRAFVPGKGYVGEEDNTMPRIAKLLEAKGVECEWEDEWASCEDCGKFFRTSPDCYGWLPTIIIGEYGGGSCICPDCIDHADYLEELEGGHNALKVDAIDPAEHGYHRVDDEFETGFHRGQDDSPAKVAKALQGQGITRFLFRVDSVGQFDSNWSVWIHDEEWEKFKGLQGSDTRFDPGMSPSECMERGLKAVTHEHRDGHVTVNHIDTSTGECTTEFKTKQEFIDGR